MSSIRDIIEALKEIQSQLADQNKYLDVLTEKYIKPATQKPQVVYIDDEEWVDEIQPSQEDWHRSLITDRERLQMIKDRFFELMRTSKNRNLRISCPSTSVQDMNSGNRGSIEVLAATWPAYQEPPPNGGLGLTYDSGDSWFDYGWLCGYTERFVEGDFDEEEESSKALCAAVDADSELQFRPLPDRIERKVEEVKGLRDGLFNATSVKEASKGTRLAENSRRQNRYILVFTVATVFYLPMGFVTSFFGMHLFDPDDGLTASQTPFIITFVVLSIATYVIATVALLVVRDDDWICRTLESWELLAASLGIQL
ncbi:hypothetical protein N7449_000649 [Penicillium cf. viridicatum]|uniref:Uncharacterized protein n=1 Tax=Penicillium cf. viridicatum TaxID=2972119 RepID=A0A9W9N5F1_9EURO|nr:hypothetical protein N7449_000649 [Penicillium cf. viridicatum]